MTFNLSSSGIRFKCIDSRPRTLPQVLQIKHTALTFSQDIWTGQCLNIIMVMVREMRIRHITPITWYTYTMLRIDMSINSTLQPCMNLNQMNLTE